MNMKAVWMLLLTLALLLPVASPIHAGGQVGDGTPASCHQAALAEALLSGGLITFNCGGPATILITETLLINTSTIIDGGGQITLDGGGSQRIIQHTAGTLTLQNLTIANALAAGHNVAANGAGVLSQGSGQTLNLTDVTFSNNISNLTTFTGQPHDYGGGAVYIQGGHLNVTGGAFNANAAQNSAGGAIHSQGSNVTITGAAFTGSSAIGAGRGGALALNGTRPGGALIITGSTFSGSAAHNQGGAVYFRLDPGSDLFRVDTTSFVDNAVIGGDTGLGGAISGGGGRVDITRSLFASNRVARPDPEDEFAYLDGSGGAAAFIQPTRVTIANTTFTANRAEGASSNASGGALHIVGNTQQFRLINTTIAYNYAGGVGGGISSGINGVLRNTIVAHNIADNGGADSGIQQQCSARLVNGGNNIQYPDQNPDPSLTDEVTCALGSLIADPLLDELDDNGGPTPTMALRFGSPAIDLGSNTVCAADPVNNRDQRGENRPSDGNGNGQPTCDIGAFEYYVDIPPFAPVLLSPVNGANTTTMTPLFNWQRAPFADSYRIQVTASDFNDLVINQTLTGDFYTPGILLPGAYLWRVQSINQNGITTSQARALFVVSAPGAAPVQHLLDTPSPALTWGVVSWATGYEVQVATASNFVAPVFSQVLDAPALSVTPDPLPDGIYYWRVRARRANGTWSGWSQPETFVIVAN
jgi:hypothetical protein